MASKAQERTAVSAGGADAPVAEPAPPAAAEPAPPAAAEPPAEPAAEPAAASLFPIRELTRRLGASKRVVEHAEAKGLVQPAGRTPLGHKLYGEEQEKTLRLILRMYEFGFSAERIKTLLRSPEDGLPSLVAQHGQWLAARVEEARRRQALFERERDRLLKQVRQYRRDQGNGDVSRSEGTAPPDGAATDGAANASRAGLSRRRDVQVAA